MRALETPREKINREMRSGLYALFILKAIDDLKKSYGYEIVKYIEERSNGKVKIKDATVYPILRYFAKKKILRSFWTEPSLGVPRKYYMLTDEGKKLLEELMKDYEDLRKISDKIIKGGSKK